MKDDDGTFREHRYSLSSPEHNTVLGENDSDELFGDYESALEQANKNRSLIDILYVTKDLIKDAIVEQRTEPNWKNDYQYRFVLTLKDGTVIYKDYMTYVFGKKFSDEAKRQKFIKNILNDFTYNRYESKKADCSVIKADDLMVYFCDNSQNNSDFKPDYASRGYFRNHYFKKYY